MNKTLIVGYTKGGGEVLIHVRIYDRQNATERPGGLPSDRVLSIYGEAWSRPRTDEVATLNVAGQCADSIVHEIEQWAMPHSRFQRIVEIWKRWHLNSLRAGCEHQRAEGWETRPIDPNKPLNAYGIHFEGQRTPSWNMLTWVDATEHPKGLLCAPCRHCGYKYGSSWLYEKLPAHIIGEIETW